MAQNGLDRRWINGNVSKRVNEAPHQQRGAAHLCVFLIWIRNWYG